MKNIVGIMIVVLTISLGAFSIPVSADEAFVKVIIDPGHGGADPGASGNGLEEKVLTLKIATLVNNHLNSNYDVETIMTRTSDETLSLEERSTMANEWGADFYLSTHINAGGGTGFEDFTFKSRMMHDPSVNAESKRIQAIIHTEIQQVLVKYNVRDRGSKEANFHVLRETHMPSVLTETMFIDNEADAKLLKNENFINDIAIAHSVGTAKALDLPFKSTTSTPEPELELEVKPNIPSDKPVFSSSKVLKKGDIGRDVGALQSMLNYFGYKIAVDNSFGNGTFNALKDFQRKNGLTADGRPGPATQAKFKHNSNDGAVAKPTPPPTKPVSKPVFSSSKVLKQGDIGRDVGSLQSMLNYFGYNIAVDNSFGNGTLNALKDFQRKNGLTADGRPGPATQAKFKQNSNDGTIVEPSKPSTKPVSKPVFSSSKVLKKGDIGRDVGSLQSMLNYFGYKIAVDNSFGKGTLNALKNFQRKNGLTADGRPGPSTQAKFKQLK